MATGFNMPNAGENYITKIKDLSAKISFYLYVLCTMWTSKIHIGEIMYMSECRTTIRILIEFDTLYQLRPPKIHTLQFPIIANMVDVLSYEELHNLYCNDQAEEDEMGRACSAHGGEEECI
jgi:hypothetical protein